MRHFCTKKIEHIVLSHTRRHVESDRKLGEYFFLDTVNPGFQRLIKPFLRVFKVFPHSKGFLEIGSNILRNKSALY